VSHKHFIIATITNQLENISQIEHIRHRSAVNLLARLITYTQQPKKPSLRLGSAPRITSK